MAYIYGSDTFWDAKVDLSDPGGAAINKWMAADANAIRTYLFLSR